MLMQISFLLFKKNFLMGADKKKKKLDGLSSLLVQRMQGP